MKIVKLKGGLGNQLFQYSYACLLKKKTNEVVKIDLTGYDHCLDDDIRKPRIMKMSISLPIATQDEINEMCLFEHNDKAHSIKKRMKEEAENLFNRYYFYEKNRAYIEPLKVMKNSFFDGYWQSWKYVDEVIEEIRQEFVPNYKLHDSTIKMIDEVKGANSVFVGVRKGDYAAEKKHYGSFGNEYYQNAMRHISSLVENPVFYVFSNDIAWVKENLDFSGFNVKYREKTDIIDDFEDFIIMSECKHSIIINSTYHWWAARLRENENKIIVAPDKWFFDNKPIDIIPPHWHIVNVE